MHVTVILSDGKFKEHYNVKNILFDDICNGYRIYKAVSNVLYSVEEVKVIKIWSS